MRVAVSAQAAKIRRMRLCACAVTFYVADEVREARSKTRALHYAISRATCATPRQYFPLRFVEFSCLRSSACRHARQSLLPPYARR